MATTLKTGVKDLCACCNKTIIYEKFEFWKDTGERVPAGPPYVYVPSTRTATSSERAKVQAYDNWREYRNSREIVNAYGRQHPGAIREDWFHILSWPVEKISDISRDCGGKSTHHARPSGWCMESLNTGGYCKKQAKEIVDTGYGGKKALCGIHLGHLRKAAKKAEEYETQREIDQWRSEALEEKIRDLAYYGIQAQKEWIRHHTGLTSGAYTGMVIVDPDKLLEILQENIEVF